jgi:hypothetical protein
MADTYDVDIGDAGADYARGIAYPSTSELSVAAQGINAISKGVFGVLGSMQSSSKPSETSVNRELYKGFVSDIQLLRGQTGLGLRSGVNAAISKWSAQGLKVNAEVSKYVKATTNIDLDYLNANPEQDQLNKIAAQLSENPAYYALGKDNLISSGNENPSDQQIIIEASRMIAEQEAAALVVSNANTLSSAEYAKQEPFWINTLDRTRELGVKALAIELAGGNASAETIEKFRANVFLLEQNYIQPRGVSDEEFQGVRNRLDGLKEMVDFISGYDTRVLEKLKIDTLNNVDLAIMNQMKAANLDPTMQRAILGNLDNLSEVLLAKKHNEVLKFLQDIPVDNINYENIEIPLEGIDKLTEITDDPNAVVSQNTLTTEDQLFAEVEIQKATELNNRTRGAKSVQSLIDYSLTFEVLALDPKALEQDENARKLFLKGIGRTSLLMSKSSEFIDSQMFNPKTGLFSNKTFDLLEKIKIYDPSGYELAVAQLKNVLQKQSQVFQTQTSGELQSSFFNMTALGEVEYDLERRLDTGQIRMDKRILPLLNNYATIHYNGNVTEMIADSGKRLSTFERSQLDTLGFKVRNAYQDYRQIETTSKMYKQYVKNMERLGMDTTMIEQTLIKGVDVKDAGSFGSLQNPYPIQWSNETDTDEILFMSLDKGEHYLDINGDVRRKQ